MIYGKYKHIKSIEKNNQIISLLEDVKIQKRYKCPYCEYRGIRDDLVSHIEDEHEDMIPETYSANRVVFNYIYKKENGSCIICKKPTRWNDEANKYDRLCTDPNCNKEFRKKFEKNMVKVYNKVSLLDDAEHQQKMLANRGISGTYKFTDGGLVTYTGTYEKKVLEYFDKVLRAHSKDIMAPGPTFEYEYEGKKHKWITDIYYIPFNLVIEVKDGGSNPNNRNMQSYREKQVEKEKMITDLGTFNYLRLTDNQFDQLLTILAELKMEMIDDVNVNKNAIIRIHESLLANALPVNKPFLISYQTNGSDRFALSNDIVSDKIVTVVNGKLKTVSSKMLENKQIKIYEFTGNVSLYNKLLKEAVREKKVNNTYIYETLSNKSFLINEQLNFDSNFKEYNMNILEARKSIDLATLTNINTPKFVLKESFVYETVSLCEDINGFFIMNPKTKNRTISHEHIADISHEELTVIRN